MAAFSRPGVGPGAVGLRSSHCPPPRSRTAELVSFESIARAVMVWRPGVREATILMVQVRSPVLLPQNGGPEPSKVASPLVVKHTFSPAIAPALCTVTVATDTEDPSAGID